MTQKQIIFNRLKSRSWFSTVECVREFHILRLGARIWDLREDIEMWDPDKDEVEQFLQGLRKAGLKYGSADSAATEIEPKLKSDPTAAAR